MSIKGIRIKQQNRNTVFYIDELSFALKSQIRTQLTSVFHGYAETKEMPDVFLILILSFPF